MSATTATAPPMVLVLASGQGRRFRASGGRVHKLQAMLGPQSVMEHTLQAVRDSGLPWHVEAGGHPGMGDSIAAAVRATPQAGGWLVLPADLPLLRPRTLQQVAAALAEAGVAAVQPVFEGQRGHPVAFGPACREALLALQGEAGAAAVLRAQRERQALRELAVDDIGTVTDVDTLDDLARAEALWRARG